MYYGAVCSGGEKGRHSCTASTDAFRERPLRRELDGKLTREELPFEFSVFPNIPVTSFGGAPGTSFRLETLRMEIGRCA